MNHKKLRVRKLGRGSHHASAVESTTLSVTQKCSEATPNEASGISQNVDRREEKSSCCTASGRLRNDPGKPASEDRPGNFEQFSSMPVSRDESAPASTKDFQAKRGDSTKSDRETCSTIQGYGKSPAVAQAFKAGKSTQGFQTLRVPEARGCSITIALDAPSSGILRPRGRNGGAFPGHSVCLNISVGGQQEGDGRHRSSHRPCQSGKSSRCRRGRLDKGRATRRVERSKQSLEKPAEANGTQSVGAAPNAPHGGQEEGCARTYSELLLPPRSASAAVECDDDETRAIPKVTARADMTPRNYSVDENFSPESAPAATRDKLRPDRKAATTTTTTTTAEETGERQANSERPTAECRMRSGSPTFSVGNFLRAIESGRSASRSKSGWPAQRSVYEEIEQKMMMALRRTRRKKKDVELVDQEAIKRHCLAQTFRVKKFLESMRFDLDSPALEAIFYSASRAAFSGAGWIPSGAAADGGNNNENEEETDDSFETAPDSPDCLKDSRCSGPDVPSTREVAESGVEHRSFEQLEDEIESTVAYLRHLVDISPDDDDDDDKEKGGDLKKEEAGEVRECRLVGAHQVILAGLAYAISQRISKRLRGFLERQGVRRSRLTFTGTVGSPKRLPKGRGGV